MENILPAKSQNFMKAIQSDEQIFKAIKNSQESSLSLIQSIDSAKNYINQLILKQQDCFRSTNNQIPAHQLQQLLQRSQENLQQGLLEYYYLIIDELGYSQEQKSNIKIVLQSIITKGLQDKSFSKPEITKAIEQCLSEKYQSINQIQEKKEILPEEKYDQDEDFLQSEQFSQPELSQSDRSNSENDKECPNDVMAAQYVTSNIQFHLENQDLIFFISQSHQALICYDTQKDKIIQRSQINKALATTKTQGILMDELGQIWFSVDQHLIRIVSSSNIKKIVQEIDLQKNTKAKFSFQKQITKIPNSDYVLVASFFSSLVLIDQSSNYSVQEIRTNDFAFHFSGFGEIVFYSGANSVIQYHKQIEQKNENQNEYQNENSTQNMILNFLDKQDQLDETCVTQQQSFSLDMEGQVQNNDSMLDSFNGISFINNSRNHETSNEVQQEVKPQFLVGQLFVYHIGFQKVIDITHFINDLQCNKNKNQEFQMESQNSQNSQQNEIRFLQSDSQYLYIGLQDSILVSDYSKISKINVVARVPLKQKINQLNFQESVMFDIDEKILYIGSQSNQKEGAIRYQVDLSIQSIKTMDSEALFTGVQLQKPLQNFKICYKNWSMDKTHKRIAVVKKGCENRYNPKTTFDLIQITALD